MAVFEKLDSILSLQLLNDQGGPTASIAVLDNGKISTHVITGGNENDETVYQACSISKAITGLAVARLVDLGRISYDTRAIDHLSDSTIASLADTPTARNLLSHVTVEMLLSHTAGLSQGGFPGYVGERPTAEDIFAGRAPSNTPKVVFRSFPGARWEYAGAGYLILQLVLENLTGTRFPEMMQELVLGPLGMTRSSYADLPADEKNFTKPHWTGYTDAGVRYHHFVESAAAGLWTTPTDLLKAVLAVQQSLNGDEDFITRTTARKAFEWFTHDEWSTQDRMPSDSGMGRGWFVTKDAFAHAGGNWPGYTCYCFGFENTGLNSAYGEGGRTGKQLPPYSGIAVMVNTQSTLFVVQQRIVSAIFYAMGWDSFEVLPSLYGKDEYAPFAAPKGTPVDRDWVQWKGKWENGFEIVDEDGPALKFGQLGPLSLRTAAAPLRALEGGKKEIILAVDGLTLGLRLSWKDDQRIVQSLNTAPRILKRI